MAHVVDSGPKNDSDSEKKTEPSHDSSSGEMYDPKTKIFDAKAILWTFGKCLTALLPVYLAGYYRMSTSLVVFGMVVYAGWKHTRETKEARLKSAVELVNDEQEYISSKSFRSRRDLPSWVNFPDVEKVEWLNKVIQQAWPFIGQYLEKLLTETIAPSIRGSSSHLQTLSFTKPMRVVGVKAHMENEKGQILLDVYISYVGDVEINVEVKRYFCKAGVKGIQKLTINWTGLTNLLDVPGLNAMSDTKIMDAIASFLVLPNRLTVPLVADLHVAQLRCPLPRGVVRIHLLEADGLASTDNYVKGVMAGMSDPYALLRVGPQTFKSRHLDNTLNPKWDEMYEVIVHEVPGQELEVEMFDKDPDHDDFLGRTKLDLGIVKKSKIVDEWFNLKDTPTGRVHLRLEWLTLEANTERLEEVLKRNESVVSQTAKPPSAAILAVYLDKAEALPMKKGNKVPNPIVQISMQDVTRDSRGMLRIHLVEAQNLVAKDNMMGGMVKGKSDPYVKIQIGGETFKSQVIKENLNPTWNEMYEVVLTQLPGQELTLEVFDKDMDMNDDFMGRLKMNLSDIISSEYINEWFTLSDVKRGRVHLALEWLPTVTQPEKLQQLKKSGKEPKVGAELILRRTSHRTTVCDRTSSPQWDEAFHFLVQDPLNEDLVVKILCPKETESSEDHEEPNRPEASSIRRKQEEELVQKSSFEEVPPSPVSRTSSVSVPEKEEVTEVPEVSSSDDLRPLHTSPDPSFGAEGVLRLHLLEAEDLVAKDNMMGGMVKGKSDPYVKIHIGDTVFKSHVIKENLNPTWNEMYELVMTSRSTSDVLVEVFDKDMDKDDFLGRVKISLQEIIQSQLTDKWIANKFTGKWFSLSDVKHGQVHMILEWLPTVTQPDRLQKALQLQSEHSYQNKSVASAALFFILLERAHDLQLKKSGKEPKAAAELVLGDISYKTKVCERSTSPEWSEAFHFLIHNPTEEILIIKILDSSLDTSVLHRKKPVVEEERSDLSNVPDSTISEGGYMEPVKTFGSAHEEHRHMDKPEEQSPKKVSPSVPAEESKVSSSTDVRPQKTSHDPSFGTKGVLRIHLLEAQDLVAKDNMMGGMVKGKSDPYVKIHIGETTFKSHVIKENLNPTWNEMYEMVLRPDNNLDVKFEVYDKDFESDDFLGRFKLKLGHIISSQYDDEWFTLNDIKHGRVHVVLEWLPTSTQRERLDQVMQMQSSQTYQNKSVPSAALLFIHLERAHDLPVCDRSTSPHWNEAFDFLVHDPKKDILVIKISSAWDQPMGSLVLPIRELLSKPDLLMDQWLDLDGASPKSQILLRAQLKILDSKMAALLAMGSGPVLRNKQTATTGQIKISLTFQKKLTVIIHACRGLVTSSKDSLDTYVSLILLPDKSKATKRKTSVKKKNLNPEFNERFEFDMSVEDAQRRELSVCVKNASTSFMNRDKDLIGQVQIDLGHVDLIAGVTE
ncbi:hypothetical protein cypCar_00007059 [Cyprinus carpio]|nr:hypothetical protein cypCar_00007059 [Cyprinus carpio]